MVLGAGVSDGGLLVDVDVPQRHLATAAALVTEALADPVFPDDEVRRILRNRLAEIEQERASSAHRAARELARTLLHADDRASRPTAGTTETIGALTRDDLVEFHATAIGPQGATVVVAGDLTGVDVVGVLEGTLGTWSAPRHRPAPSPVAPRPRRPMPPASSSSTAPGRSRPRSPWAAPGPDRSRRRRLGALPGAVLRARRLPERPDRRRAARGEGLHLRHPLLVPAAGRGGLFLTSGSVRSDVTGEAVEILLGILDGAREGFTDAEVRSGVDYVAKTAPGRYATADAVADETAPWRSRGCRSTSRPATCGPWPSSAGTTSTAPTARSRRGSGAWSSSGTPAPWCRHSTAGWRSR